MATPAALVSDGGRGGDPGAERHHVLRQLSQQLELHPAVEAAWGTPTGAYGAVEARLDPARFGRDAETASLRVVWQPNPDANRADRRPALDDPPGPRTSFHASFRIHYSEPGGFDCGFHNEPNPHVDGWFHVQWRASPDEPYEYEPAALGARTPTGALWEVLEALESMLRGDESR